MIRHVLAVLAAFSLLFGAMPADARERGKPAEKVWMSGATRAEIVDAFLGGTIPCIGADKPLGTCFLYNPVTDELRMMETTRPPGSQKNQVTTTIVQMGRSLDGTVMVMRNEQGVLLARLQITSEQQNAAAIWNAGLANVPAAIANGMGAGLICTIAGCNNNGGGGSVAYAISGSEANALAELVSTGGCGSAPCGAPASTPKKD